MKLLEPIQVGKMTLKNRIMFPPLTTGYEERDGSIGQRSLSFYERLALKVAYLMLLLEMLLLFVQLRQHQNFIMMNKFQLLNN